MDFADRVLQVSDLIRVGVKNQTRENRTGQQKKRSDRFEQIIGSVAAPSPPVKSPTLPAAVGAAGDASRRQPTAAKTANLPFRPMRLFSPRLPSSAAAMSSRFPVIITSDSPFIEIDKLLTCFYLCQYGGRNFRGSGYSQQWGDGGKGFVSGDSHYQAVGQANYEFRHGELGSGGFDHGGVSRQSSQPGGVFFQRRPPLRPPQRRDDHRSWRFVVPRSPASWGKCGGRYIEGFVAELSIFYAHYVAIVDM